AIATALLAGGMLAFSLSFDEVIVTTFTAGQQRMLPIWILDQLTKPRDRPVTNVTALFVIAVTPIPILLAHKLSGGGDRDDRLRGLASAPSARKSARRANGG